MGRAAELRAAAADAAGRQALFVAEPIRRDRLLSSNLDDEQLFAALRTPTERLVREGWRPCLGARTPYPYFDRPAGGEPGTADAGHYAWATRAWRKRADRN